MCIHLKHGLWGRGCRFCYINGVSKEQKAMLDLLHLQINVTELKMSLYNNLSGQIQMLFSCFHIYSIICLLLFYSIAIIMCKQEAWKLIRESDNTVGKIVLYENLSDHPHKFSPCCCTSSMLYLLFFYNIAINMHKQKGL